MPTLDKVQLKADLTAIYTQRAHVDYYYEILRERSKGWGKNISNDRRAALKQFADDSVERALGGAQAPKLLYPVKIYEVVSSGEGIVLYRACDEKKAKSTGSWWSDPELLGQIVDASPCYDKNGKLIQKQVVEFMLSAAFVHPDWNEGGKVARMDVPGGDRVAVIAGAGDWQAMKDSSGGGPSIRRERHVVSKLKMVPIPGPKQLYVPLFREGWVWVVNNASQGWPFS